MFDTIRNPLVSVIIPMFNAQAYIRSALESILNQTYKNIEVIVVDDGSTDNSKDIVLSYGQKVKYIYQENSGAPSKPKNLGTLSSSGELVTFFDSDDIMLPHKIESQVNFLRRRRDIGIVLVDYLNFTDSGEYEKTHFMTCHRLLKLLDEVPESGSLVLDTAQARAILVSENFTITDSPLLRRELIADVGMFDEKLYSSEDFDLTYRIATKYKIAILNTVGFKRRLHENNLSRNDLKIINELIKSRKKLLLFEKDKNIRKELKRFISACYISLSDYYIGSENKLALKKLYMSLKLNPLRFLLIKKLIKITLSSIGIIPTRSRGMVG